MSSYTCTAANSDDGVDVGKIYSGTATKGRCVCTASTPGTTATGTCERGGGGGREEHSSGSRSSSSRSPRRFCMREMRAAPSKAPRKKKIQTKTHARVSCAIVLGRVGQNKSRTLGDTLGEHGLCRRYTRPLGAPCTATRCSCQPGARPVAPPAPRSTTCACLGCRDCGAAGDHAVPSLK